MRLRFDESQINVIVKDYKIDSSENEVIGFRSIVRARGYLTKEQLRKVAYWKAPRSAGHVEKNDEEYIKEITAFAFATADERARIETLTILDGFGWPSASVLLHLYHKDKYPILDFRALWSCGLEVPKQYGFAFWWDYVEFCRSVAEKNGVSMRVLDRALWQYSDKNQNPRRKAVN